VSEVRFAARNDRPVGLRDDHKALIAWFAIRRATAGSFGRRTIRTN
jgi:hypothetical protein